MHRLPQVLLSLLACLTLSAHLFAPPTDSQSIRYSLSLDGSSRYVSVPNSASIDISGPITIEAWIKLNSVNGNYQDIVCREAYGQAGSGGGYELGITNVGKIRLDLFQSPYAYTTVIGSTTVSAGTWHHVAGVFNGSQMRVYLDGIVDGSVSTSSGPASGTSPLKIGTSTYANYYFGGLIDDVRISAAALYNSNFTAGLGTPNNTRAHWKFDDQTANDSVNGIQGTLHNGATFSTDVPVSGGGGPHRPVPVSGGPYSTQVGQGAQFSSSGSFDPDGTITGYHWNFGDGASANTANPSHAYTAAGLYTATLTVTDNAGLLASATSLVTVSGSTIARLDPKNQTGGGAENPLSGNFNWTLPILNLPGRAGLDLGVLLSYNSLVWTHNGSYISFDDDRGFPAPGFRLGFPTIQASYLNSETGKQSFLLISADGSRIELRQVGSSTFYESADSAHMLFDTATLVLRSSDGTQLSYSPMGSDYVCSQVKDRNGNYLTINYHATGTINTIIDTLGRTITFEYLNGYLRKITQQWTINGSSAPHTWATFEYIDVPIETKFSNGQLYGPTNGSILRMLSRVILDDNSETPANNSHYDFSYTSWGQVWKISSFAADNHLLNYRSYNLPQNAGGDARPDCPRFTERRDWAQYENGDVDGTVSSSEEVVTTFAEPWDETWTMPGETSQVTGRVSQVGVKRDANTYVSYDKIYFIGVSSSQGWRRGLPALVKTYDQANVLQRQVVTLWEQDDETKSYPLNPRVKEKRIYDPSDHQRRTRFEYESFSLPLGLSCKLPRDVIEYDSDSQTVLRTTRTEYRMEAPYTTARLLGVIREQKLFDGNASGHVMSKSEYFYDEPLSIQGSDAPVQHDNAGYGASFISGRGNLTTTRRYDVLSGEYTETKTKYNTSGSKVYSRDAANHEITIQYTDSFSDGQTRNTRAYATKITDPDGYSSKSKYNYDFGLVTWNQTPKPNSTAVTDDPTAPQQFYIYDNLGRLERISNSSNNAYTKYVYPANKLKVETFQNIQEGRGESHSFKIVDGVGRVIASAINLPNSTGGYSGQRVEYDVVGRLKRSSNPTETSAAETSPFEWQPLGDNQTSGWKYSEQTYDWKGRPLITTKPDGTTKEHKYSSCGCAGGDITTSTDEGILIGGTNKNRQEKIHRDSLGRPRQQ